jgi:hypothetical protein
MKNKINIFEGRTKEWDSEKGKYRQYRSNQGRSPKQMESNYKVMAYGCITFLVALIVVGLINVITNVLG